MLILPVKEVQAILSMREAIEAVRDAYLAYSEGEAIVPKRTTIDVKENDGVSMVLPSYVSRMGVLGTKLVTVFFHNPAQGLPLVNAVIIIQDGKTGKPLAIMGGRLPTAIKTGAATGVATSLMAREDARSVGLFGTGYQAPWQLEAVCEVRSGVREIWVFDIDQRKSREFTERMHTFLSRFQVEVHAAGSPQEAVRGRDIIVTVTTSTTPVFNGDWIEEGAHINAVGSFTPDMQEVDETTLLRAGKVVTDVREDALEMKGDLIKPLSRGIVSVDVIDCEVGEILSGKKPGRERTEEITLFESVSMSALDVAVAQKIYENALEAGVGQKIDLNWEEDPHQGDRDGCGAT